MNLKRLFMVHNYYGSSAPSGENLVFESEKSLLQARGHEVEEFTYHSDEIRGRGFVGLVKGALATPWNPWAAYRLKKELNNLRPEVVHVHNTFPLISPSIFQTIGKSAARVITLHNYRIFCAAGVPMREGRVCTNCLDDRSVLPALRYGCYRGSRLATLPLATNIALHRALGTWIKHVDAFIALTDFQRDVMIKAGLPAELVHVKPNFYPGNPATVSWISRRPCVVFVGRLSHEKGVMALIRAWLMWGVSAPELRIVGDGYMRGELERLAATVPNIPIRFLGQLSSSDAQNEIAHSSLLVLPSECYEGFPMVVREAFAFGTPVAVSNIGPLPSIIRHHDNGLVFAPGTPQSLLNVIRTAWESEGLLGRLAVGARRSFENLYTEDANYQMLMTIYDKAIEVSTSKTSSV